MKNNKPLFVDLDGTLIREDLSDLAFSHSFKNNPLKAIFYLLVFLFRGKAYLKNKISKNFEIPFKNLTFNKAAIDFIRKEKKNNKAVYLISGSHQILVEQMDKHLNIFLKSFGTRDDFNMVGNNKVLFIKKNLKINDFDYLGNSFKDLPIWKYTKKAIHTNAPKKLIKIVKSQNIENKEILANFSLIK